MRKVKEKGEKKEKESIEKEGEAGVMGQGKETGIEQRVELEQELGHLLIKQPFADPVA